MGLLEIKTVLRYYFENFGRVVDLSQRPDQFKKTIVKPFFLQQKFENVARSLHKLLVSFPIVPNRFENLITGHPINQKLSGKRF